MMNMRGETSLVPARRMLLKNATWPSSSSAPHSPFSYFISRGGSDCRKTSFILSNLLKIFCYSQELTLTDQGRIWFIISLYCTINPDRTPPGTHLTIILNNIVIQHQSPPQPAPQNFSIVGRLLTSVYEAVTIHKQLKCHEEKKDYLPLWFLYCIAAMNALLVRPSPSCAF